LTSQPTRPLSERVANLPTIDAIASVLSRYGLVIVIGWIGALKFAPYEADSITPLVAQSPVMSFFYKHPKEYAQHMTKEGQLVPEQRKWQQDNNTYGFSRGLGTLEIIIGLLVLSNFVSRNLGLLGGLCSTYWRASTASLAPTLICGPLNLFRSMTKPSAGSMFIWKARGHNR